MFIVVHSPVVSGSQDTRHLDPSLKMRPGAGSEGDGSASAGRTSALKARTVEAVNIMLLILLEWIMGKWSEKGYVVKRVTGKKVVDVGVILKTRYGK